MTTDIIEVTKEEILEIKKQIKELARIQKEEKSLLRTPHNKISAVEITMRSGYKHTLGGIERAGNLMSNTLNRACQITNLHIRYNDMRGKPYDMHEYK